MTNTYYALILCLFSVLRTSTVVAQNTTLNQNEFLYEQRHPLRETRAVWLTTIGGLDWPRTKATDTRSRERQKAELVAILDNYKRANINTVLLQTRVRASVIYPSAIEPWELCLTGRAGMSPGYDPLAFCIDECHKRGMELHAWVVCIPIGTTQRQNSHGAASIVKRRRDLVKTAKGGEMFMQPGKAETADYIADICREIITNYDVDGISLDYIRYPESTYRFSDDELYSKSTGLSKDEWRRENITRIVRRVHDAVKSLKPWVKLSSSPIGKYADTRRYSAGGWNAYHAVWQDPKHWLRENYQDMLFPMMYFTGNNYYPFLFDWLEGNSGHPVIPGLGIYFLDPREGKWTLNEVRAEMHAARRCAIGGMAFYRGEFLTKNCKGLYNTTCEEFFPYPALTARMVWMGDTLAPSAPTNLTYADGKLRWSAVEPCTATQHPHSYILYNVYGANTYPVDTSNPENLLAVNLRTTEFVLSGRATKVRYFAVTAIDRLGNESTAIQESEPVYEQPYPLNVPRLINPPHSHKGAAWATPQSRQHLRRKNTFVGMTGQSESKGNTVGVSCR